MAVVAAAVVVVVVVVIVLILVVVVLVFASVPEDARVSKARGYNMLDVEISRSAWKGRDGGAVRQYVGRYAKQVGSTLREDAARAATASELQLTWRCTQMSLRGQLQNIVLYSQGLKEKDKTSCSNSMRSSYTCRTRTWAQSRLPQMAGHTSQKQCGISCLLPRGNGYLIWTFPSSAFSLCHRS